MRWRCQQARFDRRKLGGSRVSRLGGSTQWSSRSAKASRCLHTGTVGFWNRERDIDIPDIEPWPPQELAVAAIAQAHCGVPEIKAQEAMASVTDVGERLRTVTPSLERNGVISWLGLSDQRLFVLWGSQPNRAIDTFLFTLRFADIPSVITSRRGYAAVLPMIDRGQRSWTYLAITNRFVGTLATIADEWAQAAEQIPLHDDAFTTPYEQLSPNSPLWPGLRHLIPPSHDGWYNDPLHPCRARRFTDGAWSGSSALLAGPETLGSAPYPPGGSRPEWIIPMDEFNDCILDLVNGVLDLANLVDDAYDSNGEMSDLLVTAHRNSIMLSVEAGIWLLATPANWGYARQHTDHLVRPDGQCGDQREWYDVAAAYAAWGWAMAYLEKEWRWTDLDGVDLRTVYAITKSEYFPLPRTSAVDEQEWDLHGTRPDRYRLNALWDLPDAWKVVLSGYIAGRE